jgi:hypothetical protein
MERTVAVKPIAKEAGRQAPLRRHFFSTALSVDPSSWGPEAM